MTIEDRALLERFADHRDETTFRDLYRRYTPRLFALAVRLSGSAEDAEELVQEAWVRAIERFDAFSRRSSFRTWLSGIVVNCHREHLRRRARSPRPLADADEARAGVTRFPGPGRKADPIDVERALARLPDGFREVVVLFYLEGHTHREIADLLGIEVGTSKSQLARGRARLRQLLAGDAAGDGARQSEGESA